MLYEKILKTLFLTAALFPFGPRRKRAALSGQSVTLIFAVWFLLN